MPGPPSPWLVVPTSAPPHGGYPELVGRVPTCLFLFVFKTKKIVVDDDDESRRHTWLPRKAAVEVGACCRSMPYRTGIVGFFIVCVDCFIVCKLEVVRDVPKTRRWMVRALSSRRSCFVFPAADVQARTMQAESSMSLKNDDVIGIDGSRQLPPASLAVRPSAPMTSRVLTKVLPSEQQTISSSTAEATEEKHAPPSEDVEEGSSVIHERALLQSMRASILLEKVGLDVQQSLRSGHQKALNERDRRD